MARTGHHRTLRAPEAGRRSRPSRTAALAAVVLAALAAAGMGCGASPGGGEVTPGGSGPPSASPPQVKATYPAYPDLRSGPAPRLASRQYRLEGCCGVSDFCDEVTAILRRRTARSPLQQVCLLSNATGRLRTVVPRPVCGLPGWTVTSARCSSRAVAWEELAPGDDLVQAVGWRLYAATMDPRDLRIGAPVLVAEGRTDTCMRPLFDVFRDEVCWMVQRRDGGRERGEAWRLDVATGERRLVATTPEAYHTLSVTTDGSCLLVERTGPETPRAWVRVLDRQGRQRFALDLANDAPVVQFTAYHRGWLAWITYLDPAGDGTVRLYLREPGGRVHLLNYTGAVSWPAFCGDCLFFRGSAVERQGAWRSARSTVEGVQLSTLRRFVLVRSSDDELDPGWHGLFGAPTARHRLVLGRELVDRETGHSRNVTLVRVYDLP